MWALHLPPVKIFMGFFFSLFIHRASPEVLFLAISIITLFLT